MLEFLQVKVDPNVNHKVLLGEDWSTIGPACDDRFKLLQSKPATKRLEKTRSFEAIKTKETEMNEDKDDSEDPFGQLESISEKISKKKFAISKDFQPKVKIVTSVSRILDTNQKELDFSLVTLPENFYDSYHGFIYKSCDLCHSRQSKSDLMLCMLCGELMCSHSCSESKNSKEGNLMFISRQHLYAHDEDSRKCLRLLQCLQWSVHNIRRPSVVQSLWPLRKHLWSQHQ